MTKRRRRKKRAPIRETIVRWETDTLIPLWIVLAILTAAVCETWTVGTGIVAIYGLYLGWPIGLVIASTQAMASMLSARAIVHNAAARKVTKVSAWPAWVKLLAGAFKRKLPQRRVIDMQRSDPLLNALVPLAISTGAGLASFLAAWALYNQTNPEQVQLNAILAAVAPAGSIAAALLNGIFAYGEQLIAARSALPASTKKPTGKPKPASSRPKQAPGKPSVPTRNPTTDPALAGHLSILAGAIAGNGHAPGEPFTRAEAQGIIERSHTVAKQVIRYGLDAGELETTPGQRYRYRFKGRASK